MDSDVFVENLKDRLEAAFAAVVRNDTDTKEARILKSSCLPDERFEIGDRALHYRMPTRTEGGRTRAYTRAVAGLPVHLH